MKPVSKRNREGRGKPGISHVFRKLSKSKAEQSTLWTVLSIRNGLDKTVTRTLERTKKSILQHLPHSSSLVKSWFISPLFGRTANCLESLGLRDLRRDLLAHVYPISCESKDMLCELGCSHYHLNGGWVLAGRRGQGQGLPKKRKYCELGSRPRGCAPQVHTHMQLFLLLQLPLFLSPPLGSTDTHLLQDSHTCHAL